MNRRGFLASMAALVPTWRLLSSITEIDLSRFCEPAPRIYDLSRPFTQLCADFPYRFASDGRICVRVPESSVMPAEPSESLPPVGALPWDHAERGGWQPWPAKCHLLAKDTECPTCDGEGFVVRNGNASTCRRCEGKGEGVFPGVQPLGEVHINAAYDSLIRSQIGACEYRVTRAVRSSYRMPVNPRYKGSGRTLKPTEMVFVQFRFAGGDGLLRPLTNAEPRLVRGGA